MRASNFASPIGIEVRWGSSDGWFSQYISDIYPDFVVFTDVHQIRSSTPKFDAALGPVSSSARGSTALCRGVELVVELHFSKFDAIHELGHGDLAAAHRNRAITSPHSCERSNGDGGQRFTDPQESSRGVCNASFHPRGAALAEPHTGVRYFCSPPPPRQRAPSGHHPARTRGRLSPRGYPCAMPRRANGMRHAIYSLRSTTDSLI